MWVLLLITFVLAVIATRSAAAQEEPVASPARYLAMWSLGAPLRLTQHDDYGQDVLAPIFTDALVGYVFASSSPRFRHGVGLGASVNVSDDGGYAEPVYAGEQIALMPAYLLYADFGMDLFALGHLGVPIALSGGTTAGLEVAGALGYRLLAGLGVFTELFADAFAGAGSTLHPTIGLELGLFLDYEVLP